MCQQMASTHGDIGESKETVGHIINEHDKFTETAKVREEREGKKEGGREGGKGGRRWEEEEGWGWDTSSMSTTNSLKQQR